MTPRSATHERAAVTTKAPAGRVRRKPDQGVARSCAAAMPYPKTVTVTAASVASCPSAVSDWAGSVAMARWGAMRKARAVAG